MRIRFVRPRYITIPLCVRPATKFSHGLWVNGRGASGSRCSSRLNNTEAAEGDAPVIEGPRGRALPRGCSSRPETQQQLLVEEIVDNLVMLRRSVMIKKTTTIEATTTTNLLQEMEFLRTSLEMMEEHRRTAQEIFDARRNAIDSTHPMG